MAKPIRHRDFPTLSELGVLRETSTRLVVSTAALYAALGHEKYQRCLPHFDYLSLAGPLPEKLERFLAK